jgi:hypothetical protein
MRMTMDEAEAVLLAIVARERQRQEIALKPYFHELCEIASRKPPTAVTLPDGRVLVYTGPVMEEIAGPYRAPPWLEALCRDVGEYSATLARMRGLMIQDREEMP